MKEIKKISVCGLGKVGLPILSVLANSKYSVIGYDSNKKLVNKLNIQKIKFIECNLNKYLYKNKKRIKITNNIDYAINNSDATILILPTPSKRNNEFDFSFTELLSYKIGKLLVIKKKYHLVIISSTVMPGDMNKLSNIFFNKLKINQNMLGLCYSPQFIALGSVIENLEKPNLLIIGSNENKSTKQLIKIYRKIFKKKITINEMNFINAEIAKIALNTYITTKISFANSILRICHNNKSADVDVITNAIGSDPRIGKKYLKGGISYGGPCFPRDNLALKAYVKKLKQVNNLPAAVHQSNIMHSHFITNTISKLTKKEGVISLIGLSYKENTDVTDESFSIKILELLAKKNFKLLVYDTNIKDIRSVTNKIDYFKFYSDFNKMINKTDTLVLTSNQKNYLDLIYGYKFERKIKILDCWRSINEKKLNNNFEIIYLGKN